MLNLLDRLAGWWLDWRLDREINSDPRLQELGFKRVEFDENGFHLVASFPGVVMLAQEAVAMLEANNAKNYVQFDMMPRLDRGIVPVRVTVQWAHGMSPAQKAAMLEEEVKRLKATRAVQEGSHPVAEKADAFEELRDLLSLLDVEKSAQEIAGWTDDQRDSVQEWAATELFAANDHPVKRLTKPAFLE